jgi:rhodanese-related sulfurtransferase
MCRRPQEGSFASAATWAIRRTLLLVKRLLLSSLLALVVACGGTTTAAVELVAPSVAAATIADTPGVVVVDVRTPEEFAEGHIANAVNIDVGAPDFRERLEGLDPDAPYVMYCRSGSRSAEAADIMEDLGFTDTQEVDGGIVAWTGAGLPVTAP